MVESFRQSFIEVSGLKVHYRELGQGTPLLLLHANPGDGRDFDAVIPELANYHRVIVLDWPGYGQSAPPPDYERVGVLSYYRFFVAFLEALNLPQVSIIGNSLGGSIAARFAASHPERVARLVLVSPGGFTTQNMLTRFFCRFQGSAFSVPPYWFARLYLHVPTSVTMEMLIRAKTQQASSVSLAINRALWRSFAHPENDLRDLAKTIRAPVLLIFGKRDPLISAKLDGKAAARSIPHAATFNPPCGHAPFAELPEFFLKQVIPFLTSDKGIAPVS